jgi:hypothetical protein
VGLAENKALVRRRYYYYYYYDDDDDDDDDDEVLTGRDSDLLARLLDPSFMSHVSGGSDVGASGYTADVEATQRRVPRSRDDRP